MKRFLLSKLQIFQAKRLPRQLKMVLIMALLAVGLTACPKKKGGDGPTFVGDPSAYSFRGEFCIENATGRPVARTLCVNTSTNLPINFYFSWLNGKCYDDFSDSVADDSYCSTNPFSWNVDHDCFDSFANASVDDSYCNNGSVAGSYYWSRGRCRDSVTLNSVDPELCDENRSGAYQCTGPYIAINGLGVTQTINCVENTCSGLWLYEYGNGHFVFCD